MNNNTTIEVLIAARARVARGWTQGAYARDAQGRVSELYPDVDYVCAAGAIMATHGAGRYEKMAGAMRALVSFNDQIASRDRDFDCSKIEHWNNAPERTQGDVLAAFDRAIAALQEAGE